MNATSRQLAGKAIGRALFIVYLLAFPAIGLLVANIGFCDPDTCWHLAMGKWIFTHHALPSVDPFSSNVGDFVFVKEGMPLMQQEWLSDLLLYLLFYVCGYAGLLTITALLSALSFIVIPSIMIRGNAAPAAAAIIFIVLGAMASAFRLWVRPEAFSFLSLALLILLNEVCQKSSRRALLRCALIVAAIMALWTNLHGVFVIGLVYLGGYCLIGLFESSIFKSASINWRPPALLLACAGLGTLCTPWQWHYWIYIAKLTTSQVLYTNKENGPMTFSDLANPNFYPLLLLFVLFWATVVVQLFKRKRTLGSQLFSVLVGAGAVVGVVAVRRITPFAVLCLDLAFSRSFANQQKDTGEIEKYLLGCGVPGGAKANIIGLVLCAAMALASTSFFTPPRLPMPSRLFHPPWQALAYIQTHCPPGRMLNDTKFGSIMTWCLESPPDIFVDGRFDSVCNRDLIAQFNQMRLCRGNWRELLDKFKIGWVFFGPDAPIISNLSKDNQWQEEFADETAVVLSRKSGVERVIKTNQ